jgi:hypothetical protein
MKRFSAITAILVAITFAIIVPALELNDTHLTNPHWPEHARLHEAWQLLSNALIVLLAAWLVAARKAPLLGLTLASIIALSFLFAWITGDLYGGSMLHSDGTQIAIGGINAAVLIVGVLAVLLGFAFAGERRLAVGE